MSSFPEYKPVRNLSTVSLSTFKYFVAYIEAQQYVSWQTIYLYSEVTGLKEKKRKNVHLKSTRKRKIVHEVAWALSFRWL